jgi:hypothetical protein
VNVKDTVTEGNRRPAFLAKLGWDGKVMENLRVRATASAYYTAGSTGVTLYGGDRGGSQYYGAMDPTLTGASGTKEVLAYTTGRYNPSYGDKITSVMGNLLLDYKIDENLSVESFSTIETSKGRGKSEATGERKATQFATDLVVRYGDFFVGARYNKVNSQQYQSTDLVAVVKTDANSNGYAFDKVLKGMYDVTVDRTAISAGWYLTKNVMAKAEYVKQNYGGFLYNDIRSNGKFDGFTIQAVVAF